MSGSLLVTVVTLQTRGRGFDSEGVLFKTRQVQYLGEKDSLDIALV